MIGRTLPLLVLLGGCSLFGPKQTDPAVMELTAEQRACRDEARGSPQYRAFDQQWNPMNNVNWERVMAERQAVETRLYRDCLRARGLAMQGGVEAVQPR